MAARSGKQQSSSTVFSKAESPLLRAPDVLPNVVAFPGLSPDSQWDITGDRGGAVAVPTPAPTATGGRWTDGGVPS